MEKAFEVGGALMTGSLHYLVARELFRDPGMYADALNMKEKKDAPFKASKNIKDLRALLLASKVANPSPSSAQTENSYITILSQLNDDDDDNDSQIPCSTPVATKRGKRMAEGEGKRAKKSKHAHDED